MLGEPSGTDHLGLFIDTQWLMKGLLALLYVITGLISQLKEFGLADIEQVPDAPAEQIT